jgi:hypothetical protein
MEAIADYKARILSYIEGKDPLEPNPCRLLLRPS